MRDMPDPYESTCKCAKCEHDLKTEGKHGIAGFIHCKQCLEEGKRDKIAVGVSLDHKKLIVICEACDGLVVAFDI